MGRWDGEWVLGAGCRLEGRYNNCGDLANSASWISFAKSALAEK